MGHYVADAPIFKVLAGEAETYLGHSIPNHGGKSTDRFSVDTLPSIPVVVENLVIKLVDNPISGEIFGDHFPPSAQAFPRLRHSASAI